MEARTITPEFYEKLNRTIEAIMTAMGIIGYGSLYVYILVDLLDTYRFL